MVTATKTFNIEIITPEGSLIKQEVTEVIANSETGELGILANHADLRAKLVAAPLRLITEKSEQIFAVIGGVIEVQNNKVIVITDYAIPDTDIDAAAAQQEAKKAETELKLAKTNNAGDKDIVIAEARLSKELAILKTTRVKKRF